MIRDGNPGAGSEDKAKTSKRLLALDDVSAVPVVKVAKTALFALRNADFVPPKNFLGPTKQVVIDEANALPPPPEKHQPGGGASAWCTF